MASHEQVAKKRFDERASAGRSPVSNDFVPLNQAQLAISGLATAPAESVPGGLVVGRADDPAEREAEAAGAGMVAALRRRAVTSEAPHIHPTSPRLARAGSGGGLDGGPVSAETQQAIAGAVGRGGEPLNEPLRRSMEDVMGADLSAVRVHTGSQSADLNAEVGAQAFTLGSDIFMGAGAPGPDSDAGLELLGHELTHTIQQQGAPAAAPVRRKIDETAVKVMATELGVEKPVAAVEVPKDKKIKTTTPFSKYPDASVMNLPGELKDTSIIVLQFPDWATNHEYDQDFKEYWAGEPATAVTDQLGGGAYNHKLDLVVLREGYTEPELRHEMGHKAQNEAGINADTASVLFLEYQNVLQHQNLPWNSEKEGAEPPRLMYSSTGISTAAIGKSFKITKATQMTDEIWEEFKQQAVAALHHDRPEAEALLNSLDTTLSGRYAKESDAKGTFEQQAKFNLVAEYCSQR